MIARTFLNKVRKMHFDELQNLFAAIKLDNLTLSISSLNYL